MARTFAEQVMDEIGVHGASARVSEHAGKEVCMVVETIQRTCFLSADVGILVDEDLSVGSVRKESDIVNMLYLRGGDNARVQHAQQRAYLERMEKEARERLDDAMSAKADEWAWERAKGWYQ